MYQLSAAVLADIVAGCTHTLPQHQDGVLVCADMEKYLDFSRLRPWKTAAIMVQMHTLLLATCCKT